MQSVYLDTLKRIPTACEAPVAWDALRTASLDGRWLIVSEGDDRLEQGSKVVLFYNAGGFFRDVDEQWASRRTEGDPHVPAPFEERISGLTRD